MSQSPILNELTIICRICNGMGRVVSDSGINNRCLVCHGTGYVLSQRAATIVHCFCTELAKELSNYVNTD